ncbi:PssE/Cps14G family polysaccharide biosynthesis glycosyltransferase [Salibacterium halotolerans]|uniref:UDP-N-acetylglucosamine transferase subunit ALG13 n=1 Tax=Salibacterium halotolerans TaxID=1884432 RepID=A0A1I5WXE6_9BACI|nr:PssE/Cps14G family polysaccharide biosynthesis glycosyltransferase [Salibacterium halotolerans]SFQ24206.1 UDP-N-acetylglucosamine transferase subunit ALG13 [Salibacterium halotolerans]
MIFIVLGTHELPFSRLLDEMQRLIDDGTVTEEVVVQSGHTDYSSSDMRLTPFLQFDEMERTFDEARVIVSHGGTGSIITGVKKEKPVIAVPRLSAYGEHNDDHQTEIVEQFQSTGHIIALDSPAGLGGALQEAETFKPAPFVSGRDNILDILRNFINRV